MSGKPHRIRVRTLDGKSRDQSEINRLKSNQLGMPHLDIVSTNIPSEFIICAAKDTHIEQVRGKLASAGLEAVADGDTTTVTIAAPTTTQRTQHGSSQQRGASRERGGTPQHVSSSRLQSGTAVAATNAQRSPGKPYGFVSLPQELTTAKPVWHDGERNAGRLSGEIRLELESLTPLLVGWDRQTLNEGEPLWQIPLRKVSRNECAAAVEAAARATYPNATDFDERKRQQKQKKAEEDRVKYVNRVQDHIVDIQVQNAGWTIDSKSVLCPLRAPWGQRPVIIPGDSLKGLLRHELGALLGTPMERVAERSYSYRPNALFPNQPNPRLVARIARVPNDGIDTKAIDDTNLARVPTQLELLPMNLRYDKRREQNADYYRFDDGNGAPYRGGQGAGDRLNSKRNLHRALTVNPNTPTESATVSKAVQDGYLQTVRHLVDLDHGHFSERHPDVPNTVTGNAARDRILAAARDVVFQPGDFIWVEWDTEKKCIVSLGWHYYYRWAYTDAVRKTGGKLERHGLFPLDTERALDDEGAPEELSAVRRLFGYTGDNDGSKGIGKGDHAQLMGRVSVNAALEVVGDGETEEQRFLKPTFLKELGMPRPSAVEHYLKQPHHPNSRPSDRASLVTYGDAAGYDEPGELAGRKFYLDRKEAYTGEPWKDDSPVNRANERSTLALEASKPSRKFRFTIRFRDLDAIELAAIFVALCPDQFKTVLGGTYGDGYCSKLGYARPLGWGSVRIEAKGLLLLDDSEAKPTLNPETDLNGWVKKNHQKTAMQDEWLAIHRRNHPDAADYPTDRDRDGNENIYTFHTNLRADHSRNRRYRKEGNR